MKNATWLVLMLSVGFLAFCQSRETGTPSSSGTEEAAVAGLPAGSGPVDSSRQADKGIGPVTELKLGPVDAKLAAQGRELFVPNCGGCHGFDRDMTGPSLRGVLDRRTPEFVMNMVLNTAEMEQKNETIRALIKKFNEPMPHPFITDAQARAILEYLRTAAK